MKLLPMLLATIVVAAGCGNQGKEKSTAAPLTDTQLAEAVSQKVVGKFGGDLKTTLMTAINHDGAVNALEICKVRAPQISTAHSKASDWTIARVTDRPRNPDDRANDHQMVVLAKLADTAATVDGIFAEWQTDSLGDSSYCYYQAIRTGDLCLNCHGTPDKLAPGVSEKLAEIYPDDEAVGYSKGDLRGMFVVTVAWPKAKTAAQEFLASDSADATGN